MVNGTRHSIIRFRRSNTRYHWACHQLAPAQTINSLRIELITNCSQAFEDLRKPSRCLRKWSISFEAYELHH